MVKVIPKRTFLLRQEKGSFGTKDIVVNYGEKIEVEEKEAIQFWGSFEMDDATKAKLLKLNKTQGHFLASVGRIV